MNHLARTLREALDPEVSPAEAPGDLSFVRHCVTARGARQVESEQDTRADRVGFQALFLPCEPKD
jgi:hypothetical protein